MTKQRIRLWDLASIQTSGRCRRLQFIPDQICWFDPWYGDKNFLHALHSHKYQFKRCYYVTYLYVTKYICAARATLEFGVNRVFMSLSRVPSFWIERSLFTCHCRPTSLAAKHICCTSVLFLEVYHTKYKLVYYIWHSYVSASQIYFQIKTNKMQLFFIYLFLQMFYMFQAVPPPIIRSTELYIQLQVLSTNTGASVDAGHRPATSWVHYITNCNTQSSAPEDV